ncbi:MAG TPA: helix-turn-helix transcriptional regulator [Pseudonocardiaceae bacterium]|jgi:transcriptional regulator with XRE-family HTH domain|nr:helix-turn-helix transcriptional regulator [Pseudonocardiaceae bacterium]
MPGNPHTSIRSRQVAARLRELREQAGLSGAEVAKRMGMSASKISRIETGNSGLQIEDVAALLGLYQVPASVRDDLLDLVRRSEERGWWTRQPGLPQLWRSLIDFEAKATRIQNYEALFVPGLLQTAEYTRAIIAGVAPTVSEAELDNLVAARMARQAVLTRSRAPQFFAVVDEGALRRPIGQAGVMYRQLQHLLSAAEQPHVTLRVVPLVAGAHAGLRGPFVILEFTEEPALVFMENHGTGLFLEEEADLAAYRVALGNILHAALAPAATAELITQLAAEFG